MQTKRIFNKVTSLLLAVMMVFGLFAAMPVTASAVETDVYEVFSIYELEDAIWAAPDDVPCVIKLMADIEEDDALNASLYIDNKNITFDTNGHTLMFRSMEVLDSDVTVNGDICVLSYPGIDTYNSNVVINGDMLTGGYGLDTDIFKCSGGVITVNGNIVSDAGGVAAYGSSVSITVNGNIEAQWNAAAAYRGGKLTVFGNTSSYYDAALAQGSGSVVTIMGNVTADFWAFSAASASDYGKIIIDGNLSGRAYTESHGSIKVNGHVYHDDGGSGGQSGIMGMAATANPDDAAVYVDDAVAEIGGNIYAGSGMGVYASNGAVVTVGGKVFADAQSYFDETSVVEIKGVEPPVTGRRFVLTGWSQLNSTIASMENGDILYIGRLSSPTTPTTINLGNKSVTILGWDWNDNQSEFQYYDNLAIISNADLTLDNLIVFNTSNSLKSLVTMTAPEATLYVNLGCGFHNEAANSVGLTANSLLITPLAADPQDWYGNGVGFSGTKCGVIINGYGSYLKSGGDAALNQYWGGGGGFGFSASGTGAGANAIRFNEGGDHVLSFLGCFNYGISGYSDTAAIYFEGTEDDLSSVYVYGGEGNMSFSVKSGGALKLFGGVDVELTGENTVDISFSHESDFDDFITINFHTGEGLADLDIVKSGDAYFLWWKGMIIGKVTYGSTVVTLYKEFLATLDNGWYSLEIVTYNHEWDCEESKWISFGLNLEKNEAHVHNHVQYVTDPTCTEQGYTTYICDCGDEYTDDYLTALGHDWDDGVVTKEPTESADGVKTFTCERCLETRTEIIPANGHTHNFTGTLTAPTCTEQGYTTYNCECGEDTYIDDYVPALGHDFSIKVDHKDAACEADGYDVFKCSRCDETETVTIPAIGHDWHSAVTAPTCENQGYTNYTCACGDEYVGDYIPALGHSFTVLVDHKDEACEESGYDVFKCVRCDETNTEVIPARGHDWQGAVTPPTCTEQGYTTYTCECGESKVEDYVIALGHDWDDGVVTKEPTDFEDGEILFTCRRCGETRTESIPANGHTHSFTGTLTAPTCLEQGFTTYSCECGEEGYVDDYVPALGHDFSVLADHKDATCEESGYDIFKCSRCDETDTAVLPVRDHDWIGVVTDPSCEDQGYTTFTCSVCSINKIEDYVPALGHDFSVLIDHKDATSGEDGYDTFKCSRCDETKTVVIPAIVAEYASIDALLAALEKADPYLANYKKYSKASFDVLDKAVEKGLALAEAYAANPMPKESQSEIDKAEKAINDAIKNLKNKSLLEIILTNIFNRIQNHRDRIERIIPQVRAKIAQMMTVTVTYNVDGNNTAEKIYKGKTATQPADPAKEGYTFIGWRVGSAAGVAYNFKAPVYCNVTLYAAWEANPQEATIISVTPSAWVEKLNGNQNRLYITVTELYSDGTTKKVEWNGLISNNAAGTYQVGDYRVYVNTKGNTQIRECYIVK